MKWILFALVFITGRVFGQTPFKGSDYTFFYQINVGKTNGSLTTPSAWLEIGKDSTTRGVRVPRVVDTMAISSPIYGLVIYQIADNGIYFRDKFGWRRLSDATILNNYLLKSDSTTYYPYHTNPKSYVINELDPVANAKTITINTGTGLLGGSVHAVSTNPSFSLTADNTTALWNANAIRGIGVSGTAPTNGQILQYNGSQYIPVTFSPSGTVTSVGLSLPSIFSVASSPITTSGTITGSFNNQFANLMFASPNGSSGQPIFRSLTNTDLPISGVVAGAYGADTLSSITTVNNKGIITNLAITPIAVSWDSVRRKPFVTYPSLSQTTSIGNSTTSNIILTGTGTDPGDLIFSGSTVEYGRVYADITGLQLSAGTTPIPAKMTILNSGNTGIGTVSPSEKLEINGNIIATAPSYSSGGITVLGRNNTSGRFETFPGSTTPTLQQVLTAGNTANLPITLSAANPSLVVNGSSSATIAAVSNIGSGAGLSSQWTNGINAAVITMSSIPGSGTGKNILDFTSADNNINHGSNTLNITYGGVITNTINSDGNMTGADAVSTNHFVTLAQLNTVAAGIVNGFATTTDANYAVGASDKFIILIQTTALRTITLPNPIGISGRELWIRCAATGSGQWQTGSTGFINCGQIGTPPFSPSANQPFSSNTTTHLISDGTNWNCFQ